MTIHNDVLVIKAGGCLNGSIPIPGDKSISHRAIMCASIATGTSQISGLLQSQDVLLSLAAVRQLGIQFEQQGECIRVHGNRLKPMAHSPIYLGNSGTSARLLCGLLGGLGVECQIEGDESLSKRPMQRIIEPLKQMGVNIKGHKDQTLPITIARHQGLRPIDYQIPIASAQVKSGLLLAALNCPGPTRILEAAATRNHTELMLQNFGIQLEVNANRIDIHGPQTLHCCDINVPADISSAAFFMVAASLLPGSDIILNNIGINPTRQGVIHILQAMGANIQILKTTSTNAEPVADIRIRYSPLKGIDINPHLVPSAIDEFPVLFVAAAKAEGVTRLGQAKELRYKESDRLHTMTKALRGCGIAVQEFADGVEIQGGNLHPPAAVIDANYDHRIAMSMAVLGAAMPEGELLISGYQTIETSFPNFKQIANLAGLKISSR